MEPKQKLLKRLVIKEIEEFRLDWKLERNLGSPRKLDRMRVRLDELRIREIPQLREATRG